MQQEYVGKPIQDGDSGKPIHQNGDLGKPIQDGDRGNAHTSVNIV